MAFESNIGGLQKRHYSPKYVRKLRNRVDRDRSVNQKNTKAEVQLDLFREILRKNKIDIQNDLNRYDKYVGNATQSEKSILGNEIMLMKQVIDNDYFKENFDDDETAFITLFKKLPQSEQLKHYEAVFERYNLM